MKNEIIPLEGDYKEYSVKIDSRNRRLNLLINCNDTGDYFRKSDIIKIKKSNNINRYCCGIKMFNYNISKDYLGDYKIGCCIVNNEQMKNIQNRFKNMK